MRGEPVLVGEFRETPAFAGHHEFAPASAISRLMAGALNRYYSKESHDPILNAVRLFIDVINIHPFEDGNGRLCRLLLSHALVESEMSLFPVLLSSFHRRGRRHYIQAVKKFDEKPSLFYTMVCQSLGKSLGELWRKSKMSEVMAMKNSQLRLDLWGSSPLHKSEEFTAMETTSCFFP